MKRTLIILVVIATACTGPVAGTVALPGNSIGTTTTAVATTTPDPPTTHDTTANSTTSTTTTSLPILGLISPSGIPVAILETDGLLHSVLTPCGNEALLTRGTPIYQTTVVIDPGHGGPTDTGAVGSGGLREKDINLRVSLAVEELLLQRGITVMLTRTADYSTRLFVRSHLADALQARILVSIHHNSPSAGRSDDPGVEVFIQKDSNESARLGGLLWQHTTEAFSSLDIRWSKAIDAGVMTVLNTKGEDAYGMIRNPETPSALIELGYISNPPEARLFATDAYPYVAAHAVVAAIEDFLNTEQSGVGLSAGRVFNPLPGISSARCEDPDLG